MNIFRAGDLRHKAVGPSSLRWALDAVQMPGDHRFLSFFPMGDDPDDPEAPLVGLVWIPPGGEVDRHGHDSYRVEIVVQGSLHLGGETVLGPGDLSTSVPREFYGPHHAGPEGCLMAEVWSRAAALPPERREPWPD